MHGIVIHDLFFLLMDIHKNCATLLLNVTGLHDREEGQMTVPIIKYLLILLPSTPSNPNYKSFLYNSKVISYNSPYNFPRPLYPDLNIKVDSHSTHD